MRHLRDGFGKLAEALKTDPKLQGVQKVSGMSWIVSKNPKLLKSLGFEVAEDMKGLEHQLDEYEARKEDQVVHQDDALGYAYMSTEKFISLYGHDSHEVAA